MTDFPLLTVTPAAREKLGRVVASAGAGDARLRVAISGRRGGSFAYDLRMVTPADAPADDLVVDAGEGLLVHVASGSVEGLRGAEIDLDGAAFGGAIVVHNPNEGWSDPLAARVQAVIDSRINPGIASHGGMVELLEVREGTAYIRMGGGCQGCAQVDVTLRQGVEVAIKGAVPEILAIVDATDHAAGTNPYFQPAKK